MADRHQAQAYPLRLEQELRTRVESAAKEQGRSINAEIAARLTSSFDGAGDTDAAALLQFLLERIDRMALQVDAIHKWMRTLPADFRIESLPDEHPDQGRMLRDDESPPARKSRKR